MGETSLGLDPRLEAALCYLLSWISGMVFFFLERKSRLVRFHSLQAILFGTVLIVADIVFTWLPPALTLGGLLVTVFHGLWVGSTVVLMYMAWRGLYFKLPYLGDMVERSLGGR